MVVLVAVGVAGLWLDALGDGRLPGLHSVGHHGVYQRQRLHRTL